MGKYSKKENIASAATIKRNGGVLVCENKITTKAFADAHPETTAFYRFSDFENYYKLREAQDKTELLSEQPGDFNDFLKAIGKQYVEVQLWSDEYVKQQEIRTHITVAKAFQSE